MDLTKSSNEVNINTNNERYYEGMLRMMREEDAKVAQENVMTNAERSIWVTFRKEGIHKYPAALEDPALATGDEYDVSFLGYPHRHIFHFKVRIQVTHNDRDIEFIQFKRWLESLYEGETKDRLWSNMKRKGAGIRHYRRRGEWVVISESEVKKPVVNKES